MTTDKLFRRDIPFEKPAPESRAPDVPVLDSTQQKKYDAVLEHFKNLDALPVKEKSNEKSPLTEKEKAWLSRECFLRYLRATSWSTENAIKRVEATLVWRRTFGVDPTSTLTADMVAVENETGKQQVFGWDDKARPCLYLKTGRQNTKASHRQVEHLVFMLERVIEFMVPGQDQLSLVIDFKPTSVGIGSLPSLSTGREVLNILQDHYPERLGKALLTNMPRLANMFLRLIHPFIDPMTRDKLVFNQPFPEYIPVIQLQSDYGGDVEFEYKQDVYWPALLKMSGARCDYYLSRWRELGNNTVGHSEYKLREGFVPDFDS